MKKKEVCGRMYLNLITWCTFTTQPTPLHVRRRVASGARLEFGGGEGRGARLCTDPCTAHANVQLPSHQSKTHSWRWTSCGMQQRSRIHWASAAKAAMHETRGPGALKGKGTRSSAAPETDSQIGAASGPAQLPVPPSGQYCSVCPCSTARLLAPTAGVSLPIPGQRPPSTQVRHGIAAAPPGRPPPDRQSPSVSLSPPALHPRHRP